MDTGTGEEFAVTLENFSGPFDLLLQLIAKHQLDVTEVALAQVTDDFLAHIRDREDSWDLGQASLFLVVAATLVDLKAARLLPRGEVDDEDDLELLEERDMLFARLLEYRAFRTVAEELKVMEQRAAQRYPRTAELEERFAALLPEVILALGPEQLRDLAVEAMTPKPAPVVAVDHVHAPRVSVPEQQKVLRSKLASLGSATFQDLVADCSETIVVVARFLALLELYREAAIDFEQESPLGVLTVRWTAQSESQVPAPRAAEGDAS